MHYHGPIIRPQTDANSIFLEVTAGCTHNSCTFCNFYSGGNPYALHPDKLEEIGKLVRKYYPNARVSTYARVDDITRKSVADIKRLLPYIDEVMIGIETGDDEAGQVYRMIYLGRLAGAGNLEESAKRSAKIFNQIHPYYMILTNVAVLPGTKLYNQMKEGEFSEATELERIKEIRTLIKYMKNEITIDTGTAASSIFMKVQLPQDKDTILAKLDEIICEFSEDEENRMHQRRASMLSV